MPVKPAMGPHSTATDDLGALATPGRRSLAARRISPRTIATYATSVDQLGRYLAAKGMPTAGAIIRREHVEAFIGDLLTRRAPGTAHNRFRDIQAFFAWCVEEGEVGESPMVHVEAPRLPGVRRRSGHRHSRGSR
jgi:site-specific recombinase XerD